MVKIKLFAVKHVKPLYFSCFVRSPAHAQMAGYDRTVEVEVAQLEQPQDECYFAWLEKGVLRFIHPSEIAVKMCSPDFFQRAIAAGEGAIVPVSVTELAAAR